MSESGASIADLEDSIADLKAHVESLLEIVNESNKTITSHYQEWKKSNSTVEDVGTAVHEMLNNQRTAFGSKSPASLKAIEPFSHTIIAKAYRGGTEKVPTISHDPTKLARELATIAAFDVEGALEAVLQVILSSMSKDAFTNGVAVPKEEEPNKFVVSHLQQFRKLLGDLKSFEPAVINQATNKNQELKDKLGRLTELLKAAVRPSFANYQLKLASLFQIHPEAPDLEKPKAARVPFTSTFLCTAWVCALPEKSREEVNVVYDTATPVPPLVSQFSKSAPKKEEEEDEDGDQKSNAKKVY